MDYTTLTCGQHWELFSPGRRIISKFISTQNVSPVLSPKGSLDMALDLIDVAV